MEEDRGPIWILPGDENPLGKLFEIQGAAIEQFFPIFAWNKQSPPIRIFNDQQDPADFRFMPHWRGVTVGSPKLRNGPGGEFHTYAQSRPFIGGGRLFGLGDKYESATFRYTTESVVVVQPPENYGLVTDTPTQNLDYGSAGSTITPDGEFDNGQVIITETTQPLTGLYQFSGESATQFFRGPYVVKLQQLSESSTNSRIQQTSDSHLIGDRVLTNKENLLAMPKLQEQEISLAKEDCLVLAIRLKVQPSDILQDLLLL